MLISHSAALIAARLRLPAFSIAAAAVQDAVIATEAFGAAGEVEAALLPFR